VPRRTAFVRRGPDASALLLAIALTAALPAQQPTFRSSVQLVRVDAIVSDAEGRPVHGLTRENFTLTDRGKPQAIQAFTEVHHDRPDAATALLPHDVASNAVASDSRLIVIVLDDHHIRPEWTERARQVTKDVVTSLGDHATMALLSSTGHYDVELTDDRARIFEMIDRFVGNEYRIEVQSAGGLTSGLMGPRPPHPDEPKTPSGDPMDDPWLRLLTRKEEPSIHAVAMRTMGASGSSIVPIPYDSETFFKRLENAAAMLAGEDARRKAFVWVSTGLPYGMGGARDALRAMQFAGVTTYAIDPVGTSHVVSGGSYADGAPNRNPTPWDRIAAGKRATLTTVSKQSGGFAIVNDDDLSGGVGRIVADLDNYYLLGFSPDDQKTPGTRKLVVKVNRPGLTVRYRQGYAVLPAVSSTRRVEPVLALSESLVPKGDLPLRVQAVALPDATRQSRVLVTLEVTTERAALGDVSGVAGDQAKYAVLAVSLKSGHVTRSTAGDARISVAPAGEHPRDLVAYSLETSLTLPPGPYQIRASAISATLNRGGSVYLNFEVPDFAKAPLSLTDLMIGPSRVPAAETDGLLVLKAARPVPFAPSLDREFSRADDLRMYFEVIRPEPRPAHVLVEAIDAQDRAVTLAQRDLDAGVLDRADLTIHLGGLGTGALRLRVTATDGTNTARRDVGVIVR